MQHVAQGIDLRGWSAETVLGATSPSGEFTVLGTWRSTSPSVCVLPRFTGERPRATWNAIQTHWGRGSGLPGSDGARDLLRRLPGWLVWHALAAEAGNPFIHHRDAEDKDVRHPLRQVLLSLVETLREPTLQPPSHGQAGPVQRYVLAMPEHFQERAQENLLAGLPFPRDDCRLLWSSVAICLAWIASLPQAACSKYAGKRVAVVEASVAEVAATVLQLRRRSVGGRRFLVPKRDLPEEGSSQRWPLAPLDLCLAAELAGTASQASTLAEAWQAATGGMTSALYLAPEQVPEAARLLETAHGWRYLDLSPQRLAEALRAAISCPDIPWLAELWDAVRRVVPQATDSHPNHRRALVETLRHDVAGWLLTRPNPPDLVLVTGCVSALRLGPDETVGIYLADLLQKSVTCKVLAPGRDFDPAIVNAAQGGAVYGGRELAGLPTYLDTLPRFSILGKDRLHWADVEYDLVPHAEWEGGKEYRPGPAEQERLQHAAMIRRGTRCVCFRLRRQGKEKHLHQEFERAPLRDCRLSFDVALRPAQGFARVWIIPEQAGLFRHPVCLDWDRMKDGPAAGDAPPDFPICSPLEPKRGPTGHFLSHSGAEYAIASFARAVQLDHWNAAGDWLDAVAKQLQSGTLYGSHPAGDEIADFLRALADYYRWACQQGTTRLCRSSTVAVPANPKTRQLLIRAGSALFTKAPAWARTMLAEEYRHAQERNSQDPNPNVSFQIAAGRCFSSPEHIRLFLECFIKHLHSRMEKWRNFAKPPGVSYWCKAFSLILRLNDEAVLHLDRREAESIAVDLADLLEATAPQGEKVKIPYQHAMFAVYYLLRFRAREEGLDFLTDWGQPGTAAAKIRENLMRYRRAGARQNSLKVSDTGETIQEALLRFLEGKAEAQDIIIMKEAHDQAIYKDDGDRDDRE